MKKICTSLRVLPLLLGLAGAPLAHADINVGVIASLTGPAAALGAETRKAVALFPTSLGGEKLNFIVLDDGKVIEQGTHSELMEQNGLYKRLYTIQQESLGWSV